MGDAGDIAKQPTGDARRFAAFISYSHADADAAAKLQRKLERYRLPKRIAETRGADTTVLGAIFRDREDLAAAASLSAAIRDAIGRAEALIVMCSPDAAASPWVAAEIELFRELHPDKPILAALLSGEPFDSFPASLTASGNEPLAADLRPEGDGEQLGFLKIVAGIAGVPLDTLIQRDAQRRIRRVTAITGTALAAMLIMAIMTTLAIQARNEAARQRAAAEGLVEYMLTDLRSRLEGVGRIEVMDAVNNRAMTYYADQGRLDILPADSLERRARILHAMGEDYKKAGQPEKAFAKFREAHSTTAALLRQEPSNADRLFAHAQSEFWVGDAAMTRENRDQARKHWQNYRDLAGRLQKAQPENPRSYLELGYSEGNLCTLSLTSNVQKPSVDHCISAIPFLRKAVRLAPKNAEASTALANRLGWLAGHYSNLKNYREALRYRTEEHAIMSGLLESDPENADYLMRYIWSLSGLGSNYAALNDYGTALSLLRDAEAASTKLVRLEPRSTEYRHTRLVLLSKLVSIGKTVGAPETEQWRTEGKSLYSSLVSTNTVSASKLSRERLNLWAQSTGGK